MILSGWGSHPRANCRIIEAFADPDVAAAVADNSSLIARGNGRSYGDAALNTSATLLNGRRDRLLAFDEAEGTLTCEAGVRIKDIIDFLLPRGWFPAVTPGTKYVTVGGAIAADVHGKNHHRDGTFGRHVEDIRLLLASGEIVACSPFENSDLFAATCGGMGLTGIILSARLRLKRIESAWISQETISTSSLAETIEQFDASRHWTYSVAWIDTTASGKDGRPVPALP